MIGASSCFNYKDTMGQTPCATKISKYGTTCEHHLDRKNCDLECNLCACSTSSGTTKEHCNDHGICEASCTKSTCSAARCTCHPGWTGDKCESGVVMKFTMILHKNCVYYVRPICCVF